MAIEDLKELKMKKIVIAFVVSALLSLLTASAQDAEKAGKVIPTPLPRDLEIQLALSTMPRHLRDKATVYVLNPAKGFEVTQKGTNGFHAFVARTGDDTFLGTWPLKEYRDDILYPVRRFEQAIGDARKQGAERRLRGALVTRASVPPPHLWA
jgi:hypothetical protein